MIFQKICKAADGLWHEQKCRWKDPLSNEKLLIDLMVGPQTSKLCFRRDVGMVSKTQLVLGEEMIRL